jgi:hypothetical protein
MGKTLLEAPQAQCPARVAQSTNGNMKAVCCGSLAHANGFCTAHQHVHRILTAWAEVGYASLTINEHYSVPAGYAACEEIALLCPAPGTWFGFTERQNKMLIAQGRKDRYTQIMNAIMKVRNREAA